MSIPHIGHYIHGAVTPGHSSRNQAVTNPATGHTTGHVVLGNAADVFPEIYRRGVRPHAVTDQTSAHDPINGYLPQGWTLDQWMTARERDPFSVEKASRASMAVHVGAMLDFWRAGVPTLDYGNNIRQVAKDEGVADAFDFPGSVSYTHRRCRRRG